MSSAPTETLPPAIILAAGESSRFWPLSTHGHKSLHRLAGKAIIEHTVESLVQAGVRELIIVQSPIARAAHFPHRTIEDQLGDGDRYGAAIHYIDMMEPSGAADAITLCADLVDGDFFVVNAEHINAGPIARELVTAKGAKRDTAAIVAAREEDETRLYGVFSVDGSQLVDFVEKPARGAEPSRLCNLGLHLVGQEYLKLLKQEPTADVVANLRALIKLATNHRVIVQPTLERFFPLKYPWHLFAMADHLRGPEEAHLADSVTVGDGATIAEGCVLESDVQIGAGVTLKNCLVGAGSRVNSDLADSILGADVTIEKGVTVEETPLRAGHIYVDVKGDTINSNLSRLGAVVGQGSRLRRDLTVRAGVLIGAECDLNGNQAISANVLDRSRADG